MSKQFPKILFVNTSDTSGGAARAAYRIYRGLQNLGVETNFFVKSKSRKDDESVVELKLFLPQNILYRVFAWIRTKIKNKIQHYKWGKYPNRENVYMSDMRSTAIHGALESIDSDIVHLHWVNQRFLPLEELVKLNKPIVWTLHDSWAFCGVCHYFYDCKGYKNECGNCPFLHSNDSKDLSNEVWNAKNEIYSKLDLHIVTPSRWLAKCATESSLFRNVPVHVIPNCLDIDVFSPMQREVAIKRWGLDPNKKYLLYGAMNAVSDRNKGFKELIEALRLVNVVDLELLVFGANEPIEALNIGLPIQYLGYLSVEKDLVMAYNASELMVVPSLSENLSCAIMESLSCGTPVACFDIGGNSDMVEHKVNGYLAKERDSADLAKGIFSVLDRGKQSFTKAARDKVLQNYTIDKVANQYKELYEEICPYQ